MKRFLASNVNDPDAIRQMGLPSHHQQVNYVLCAASKRQALELMTGLELAAFHAARIIDHARANEQFRTGKALDDAGLIPEDGPVVLAYEREVSGRGIFRLGPGAELVQVGTFAYDQTTGAMGIDPVRATDTVAIGTLA